MNKKGGLWTKIFGERVQLDLDRLNYKEYTNHKLMKATRLFTHVFYSLIFNLLFSFGWYAIVKENNITTFDQITNYSSYIGYGIGHLTYNVIHFIYNKFTKDKYHKTEIRNGNPIPKISGASIVFTVIALAPSIFWLVGKIIVMCKQRRYLRIHRNYIREENDIIKEREINSVVQKNTKQVSTDLVSSIMKELKED